MAAAMADIRNKTGRFRLHALHVNHGIRPPENCGADENCARDLCSQLKIPFTVKKIPSGTVKAYAEQHGTGIEGAARHFRYQALREEASRLCADGIFTAHTADDRLETILMAFLRGSGPAGLGALSGADASSGSLPPVFRPLLPLSRKEILIFLEIKKLRFCSDETNDDPHFFRNRIRHFLVPLLDKQFPQWRGPVLRLGETQAMTAVFLKDEAEKRLPWEKASNEKNAAYNISSGQFFGEPEIIREEAIFRILDLLSETGNTGKKPRRETLRSFIRGKDKAVNLGQCRLENSRGWITIHRTKRFPTAYGFSVLSKSAGIYKLDHITVIAGAEQPGSAEPVFYAELPLALHSEDGEKILAEDRRGRAAEIKDRMLVWKRGPVQDSKMMYFRILIAGEP
jgi:tRNA(Ile)-lysidine synthetase-like protein